MLFSAALIGLLVGTILAGLRSRAHTPVPTSGPRMLEVASLPGEITARVARGGAAALRLVLRDEAGELASLPVPPGAETEVEVRLPDLPEWTSGLLVLQDAGGKALAVRPVEAAAQVRLQGLSLTPLPDRPWRVRFGARVTPPAPVRVTLRESGGSSHPFSPPTSEAEVEALLPLLPPGRSAWLEFESEGAPVVPARVELDTPGLAPLEISRPRPAPGLVGLAAGYRGLAALARDGGLEWLPAEGGRARYLDSPVPIERLLGVARDRILGERDGTVVAMDPFANRIAWQRAAPETGSGGAVVGDDRLVMAGRSGVPALMAFDPDRGLHLWRQGIAAGDPAKAAIAGSTAGSPALLVATGEGWLVRIGRITGQELWRIGPAFDPPSAGPPALGPDGRVAVVAGTRGSYRVLDLAARDLARGPADARPLPGERIAEAPGGGLVGVSTLPGGGFLLTGRGALTRLDPRGNLLWTRELAQPTAGTARGAEGRILVPYEPGGLGVFRDEDGLHLEDLPSGPLVPGTPVEYLGGLAWATREGTVLRIQDVARVRLGS